MFLLMTRSYHEITPQLARQIKLVMSDVDGTLTTPDDSISPAAAAAARNLENAGITVGLVSGRTINGLKELAQSLDIHGPLIAENGAVARLAPDAKNLELGYSREPALRALERLKKAFPGVVREREDNLERLIDVVFWAKGIPHSELLKHLPDVKLFDSGFIMHLVQQGVSKGRTLLNLLPKLGISTGETMVFGDSTTDLSLFELLPHSVLVVNPRLPSTEREELAKLAEFTSTLEFGEGFAEMVDYLIQARRS